MEYVLAVRPLQSSDADLPCVLGHPVTIVFDSTAGANLCEMFPNYSKDQVKFVLEICGHSIDKTIDSLQNGVSATVHKLLRKLKIKKKLSESPRLRIGEDEDEDCWVEAAIAFYKSPKLVKDTRVSVSISGQPGVDTGTQVNNYTFLLWILLIYYCRWASLTVFFDSFRKVGNI